MTRVFAVMALLCALVGCGGGSSDAAPATVVPPVTVSGRVTFDFVPAVAGQGLDYSGTVARPARGVTVELLENGAATASTTTNASGDYSFASVAGNTSVSLRVRAEMLRVGAPSWDFRVLDNVNGDALYTLAGAAFDTGTADVTRNLHAPSGWGGTSYTAMRSAAPFAILDVVYDAVQLVLTAAPATAFPALKLHWSTANVGASGTGPGEIGSTKYRTDDGIYLVGTANVDTDEYDRHVIAHEFGHYLEHRFSRSDSFGGSHALSDQLDMRVAFGEAWGTAFSAMVTEESVYVDSLGPGQSCLLTCSSSFDVETTRPNINLGWFNEESLQALLFDLYDDGRDVPRGAPNPDDLALGFGPIWDVLTNEQRTTKALTGVFPFVNALKARRSADATLIDQLTSSQRIAVINDDYGSGQTNFGNPTKRTPSQVAADFSSVYDTLTVGGTLPSVCSLDDYTSSLTGAENKLASRRFVRFTVTNPGPHLITARAIAPLNAAADPDILLHLDQGGFIESSDAPAATCTKDNPSACVETFSPTLQAGDHVLEVYEWTNTNRTDESDPAHRPIGRTCFEVTVTR